MRKTPAPRQRAPSQRAIATKTRVLDAAESIFSRKGFDGATIRDIAAEAGEPVGTVHHHGGGKANLFHQTIRRRAETLADARMNALDNARNTDHLTLEIVLDAFMRPFFELSHGEPRWCSYARIVAYVSADERWGSICAECFDPAADEFISEILSLLPDASRKEVAEGFVYSVSSMLALITSRDRINTLGGVSAPQSTQIDHLAQFCAAGFRALSTGMDSSQ